MQKFFIIGLLSIIVLSACTGSTTDQTISDEEQSTLVTVYRSPT